MRIFNLKLEPDQPFFSKANLAGFAFFVFLFSQVFGFSLPLQDFDPADRTTSNALNQVFYSALFLISLFTLFPNAKKFGRFLVKEKYLTLFLLWCLLTIFWSDYPFITFKRYFRFLAAVLVCFSFLLHTKSIDRMVPYLAKLVIVHIVLSFVASLIHPMAIDQSFLSSGAWRGLADQKNTLGQISLVGIVVSTYYSFKFTSYKKALCILATLISFVVMMGSQSTTSLIILLVFAAIGSFLALDKIYKPLNMGHVPAIATLTVFSGATLLVIIVVPDFLTTTVGLFGKDLSFSGRTDLWSLIFYYAKQNLWLGRGYMTFWGIENQDMLFIFKQFVWLPTQAHMGYLDLLNETGIVGLTLVVLMIFSLVYTIFRIGQNNIWQWFVLGAIISNFTETTLFRFQITGILFLCSYLSLRYEYFFLINTENPVTEPIKVS
jgi:exopolysaccharide production protein ExoQ